MVRNRRSMMRQLPNIQRRTGPTLINVLTVPSGVFFFRGIHPRKTFTAENLLFQHMGHLWFELGHIGRCINGSVLHLLRRTNISIYTLYPCTYDDMTTIGIVYTTSKYDPLTLNMTPPENPQLHHFWAIFGPNRDMFQGVLTVAFCISGDQLIYQYIPCTVHILWHDNHRKWFRLLRDMTP